jgi:MFS family permease
MIPDGRGRAASIVVVLILGYLLSQFFRSANGVIGPNLMADLGIGAEGLASLTSVFFLTFAACQIPLGILLDRFGPRRAISCLLLVAAAGSALFGWADGLGGLSFARVLLGIGTSCLLIGPMVIYSRWFPPDRFAGISSIHLGVGTAGNLIATTPLAAVTETYGWRAAFLGLGVMAVAIAALTWVVVRDAPAGWKGGAQKPESIRSAILGLGEVFKNRHLPFVFALMFTAYASVITIFGLWGGPYLKDVHGLDGVARGNVLLLPVAASIVGYLLFGPLDRKLDTRKWINVVGASVVTGVFAALAVWPAPNLAATTALLTLMGFASGYVTMILAHGKAIFPPHLVGRGLTTLNIATMGGAAALQFLTGLVVGQYADPGQPAPVEAYRAMFGTIAGLCAVSLLIYLRVEDAKPSAERR